jgi:hypothetical protein
MFLSKDKVSGGGLGFTAEVGAEFLRLHHFRILVGAEALLPAYSLDNNWFGITIGAPEKTWVPVFLLHTRIAF